MPGWFSDLRFAVRIWRRNPGIALVALLSIALGIGANAFVFSLIRSILLRPLPYHDPERIAMLWWRPLDGQGGRLASPADLEAFRQRSGTFEEIGAVRHAVSVNFGSGGEPAGIEKVSGQQFSASLARVLGVNPLAGRWFGDADERPGSPEGIVISHRLWQRRFGGDADVPGKTVVVDGMTTRILGVMPEGFLFFDPEVDYWAPLRSDRNSASLWIAGRLRKDASLEQAREELSAIAASLSHAFPETNRNLGIRIQPLREAHSGWLRQRLLLAQSIAGFVLLIACANVAGLLLAGATGRAREIAMRTALGASRGRIVRQLLSESLLLSAAGSVAGLGLAWFGLRAYDATTLEVFRRLYPVELDANVIAAAAGLSVLTAVLFGLAPAWRASSVSVRSGQRIRSALVVFEIAIAFALLTGAGLTIRSFVGVLRTPAGLDPDGVLTFQIRLPEGKRRDAYLLFDQMRDRIAGVPGVTAAAAGITPPLSEWAYEFKAATEAGAHRIEWMPVSPDYFRTLRIPVLRGREFAAGDGATGAPVALINETLARHAFAGRDPIGQWLEIDLAGDRRREIVGVVAGVARNPYQDRGARAQVYIPYVQLPPDAVDSRLTATGGLGDARVTMTFLVRSGAAPSYLIRALRAAVASVDRTVPLYGVKTLDEYVSGQLHEPRQYAVFLSGFGALATGLGLIGFYAIMAYAIRRRTREIGIRMALGATSRSIGWMVIRRGMALLALGGLFGVCGGIILGRLLESVLYGIAATDPATYAGATVLLAAAGLLACWLPARRAARCQPAIALRHE